MTLATDKGSQVEPPNVLAPGPPPPSQFENSANNQKLLDNTGKADQNFPRPPEEETSALDVQNLGEREFDESAEHKPCSELTESPTPLKTTVTNGATMSGPLTCTTGPDQTRSNITSSPMQHELPSDIHQTPDNSTPTAQSDHPNGRTEPIHNPTPPLTLSTPAVKQPHTNGKSNLVDSTATVPVEPSLSVPLPTPSSPKNTLTSPADAQNGRSPNNPTDETEPLSRRTRSRQKRPSESLSKQPAKRARVSSDISRTSRQSISESSNLRPHVNDGGDVDMSALPSIPLERPMAGNPDAMDPTLVTSENCPPPSAVDTSTPKTQSLTSLRQATSANLDSNLDPALSLETSTNLPTSSDEKSRHSTASEDGPAGSIPLSANMPQVKSNSPSSTTSLANNPYLGLSTAFLKGSAGTSATGFNPYSFYYGPGTPITPHTPTYPYPYIYHLPSPISPHAMYPPNPAFPSSPTTQKTPSAPNPSNGDTQRQKPKRLKAHTVTSGNHNIPIVPRDKKGKPMLPLNVGIMTVIRLGEVCMREHFHTERYIFPVGYEVTRRYLSTIDPNSEVVYHCTILDGGDGPKFQIVPSDAPDRPIIAGTATGAWSSIVKRANAIRSRQHSNSVSGPDFFGLGQNTIKHLIQELPNADRLRDYVWQNFIEGGPLGGRHAAVTPALPEDYDSTLPIGALYPSERDRLKQEISMNPSGYSHYPQHIMAQAEAQRKQQAVVQVIQRPSMIPTPTMTGFPAPAPGEVGHSDQLPMVGSPSPAQSLVSNLSSRTDDAGDAQPSSTSVPTTIAGIMNAYPVPASTSASASVQAPTPTPSSTSSTSS